MKIGIAAPIEIISLAEYLDNIEAKHMALGMGGTAVNSLIIGLIKNGVRVSVYSLDENISNPMIFKGEKLKIYLGPFRSRGRDRMVDLFKVEINQLHRFIDHDKPDFINAHWTYEYALAAIKSKIPHLITVRDNAWKILVLKKDLYRLVRLYMNLKVFILGKQFNVNSEYLKKQLKFIGNEIKIIPNPIQEHYIMSNSKTLKNKVKIVSILNGWGEIKNPIPALRAFKLLRNEFKENICYTIYGPDYGPDEIAFSWATKNECEKQVIFKGKVQHKELMAELSNYDILLHPAKEESFGNMLLEALASGVPVIGGSKSGAVPEVLNYGKYGILTDINSAETIFNSVKDLINNKELYANLSKNGLQYVKEQYSSKSIANKYLVVYKKVFNKWLSD